ncbi:tRNA (adenosine(37)-N6)-threonylcarbamoyltransferase complex ATPase subunit type 1 TsaE [Clostridium aminobutyricum]|uniref:tRNA threonylcarbamoyladenosine biosynthesis protein TsaE n=1 Tax=Clostridium aminobutyricum TaxID=33953 RepID=A0A939IJP0_CLOAM|nr:tRNA (adenosine(37)-N6)-threonylcarbamoyltransferase complex ATPase subunit type 1 TsaE [Clostridium aminobutyricum]MBN7774296.1 tRNA (adenosine(37)-N6)-threonylcarbamoyltransferase complex ATPase subunit type 1 TsaE [Clostridium aminobutyricum]
MKKIIITNELDTKEFGIKLAETLTPGKVVALIGDLGTGKTALTKYIAQGLGIQEMITSPTFTIVQEYHDGRMPLYHFDVYRINDAEEMYELGYEEYFFGKGVSVVEWADLIMELIPEDAVIIRIYYGELEGERVYEIQEPGDIK